MLRPSTDYPGSRPSTCPLGCVVVSLTLLRSNSWVNVSSLPRSPSIIPPNCFRAIFACYSGSVRRSSCGYLGVRYCLLLPSLPGAAVDSRPADGSSFRGLPVGMSVCRNGTIPMPADDKQSFAAGMSTAYSKDARSESEAPLFH